MTLSLPKDWILKGLGTAAAIFAVLVAAGRRPGDARLYPARADGVTIYVINNGFHTDLAFPSESVGHDGVLAQSAQLAGHHRWLICGWGDAGFFTAQGFSVARTIDGLRALFWPNNPSLIRLHGMDGAPDAIFGKKVAVPVVLSPEGFEAMRRHIEASFRLVDNRPVVALTQADGARFFESHEHFSFMRSCSSWTSDQLSAAGLPTTPAVDGLAVLLALDLRLRARIGA